MAKAGRWLAAEHPEITEPGQWTRSTCAAWVAAIDRMTVGDYTQRRDHLTGRAGAPIAPRTKAHILMASRAFFRDCQEWEWIGRRFDPTRALALPRSVAALIGTDPRIIADDVWAKLIWAGLQLQAEDLPGTSAGSYYPLALIRALALTWLFSGLRSDEISRLRVGCIRWQQDGQPIAGDSTDVLARRRRLPARRPGAQDRHRLHQARRPARRPGHRGLAGAAARAAHTARPQDRRAGGPAVLHPRAPGREELHQPLADPGALRQGRRPDQPTSAATSPATGPARRSPASSTTPRSR